MANFSASNLVKAQSILNQNFNNPELRLQPAPILALGRRNNDIMMPSHSMLRTREDRPIEAYIIKRNKRTTTGSKRTFDHQGVLGDSLPVEILFTPFVDKFRFSLKWLDNNMYDPDVVLANQFSQCFQNIRNDIETFLKDFLFTEKTKVNEATRNGEWNATNNAFEISTSPDRGLFFEDAKSMMRQNYYAGMYDVITDAKLYRDAAFYSNQGSANATNLQFQFSGMNILESTTLFDSEYPTGVALFLPNSSFGVLDWIPRQNRQGHGDYNSYVGGYGTMTDPSSGLTMAVHGYSARANTSAANGNEQDVVIEFEVSVDISPNLAPISNTDETVVFEVAQVSPEEE